MPIVRRDSEIHHERGGWFEARWHFSFDRYRDPEQMGIGPLRVFNHDRLVPGAIWPMHPHADVEGITYVWRGTFRHADSLGADGTLTQGGVQVMTLGSGAEHSEQNGSDTEPMEFIQIWILPDTPALPPEVRQRQYTKADRTNRLLEVVAPHDGDAVKVHQQATIHVAAFDAGVEVDHAFQPGRGGYLYLLDGHVAITGDELRAGDAAKLLGEPHLRISARQPSELLLVDVPLDYRPVGIWAG
jgi:redox-sensitive bicupin YhaK (pirin superfamily)